jgi:hypothetical protein
LNRDLIMQNHGARSATTPFFAAGGACGRAMICFA